MKEKNPRPLGRGGSTKIIEAIMGIAVECCAIALIMLIGAGISWLFTL